MNVRDTHGARWDLLFRILLNTNAKIYLQLANSNPLHQQLHPNQLSNHCSGFQGQESCVAKNALVIGDTEGTLPKNSSGMGVLY